MIVKLSDKFALSLLESGNAKDNLLRAALEVGDEFKKVIFLLTEGKKAKGSDLLDEL